MKALARNQPTQSYFVYRNLPDNVYPIAIARGPAKSQFIYNGLSDNEGTGWVAEAATAAAILANAFFGKKGDKGADLRYKKREALEQVGFRWDHTKGYQPQDADNIDGWLDASLDNIYEAYKKYGPIVAQLHNKGVFNRSNTQSLSQISQIVESNGGTPINSTPGMFNWGQQGSVNSAGINYTPWLVGGGLFLLAVVGVSVFNDGSKGKSKRK